MCHYTFQNFVKNSVNVRDQTTLGELWDIFSTAIKPVRNTQFASFCSFTIMFPLSFSQAAAVVEIESSSGAIATEGNEQNEADRSVVTENGEPSQKEKKKKKKRVEESVGVETCDAPDTDFEQNQTKTTKRRKRVEESVDTCDIDFEQVQTKTKKKKKKRVEESVESCDIDSEQSRTKKKKKKMKRVEESVETCDIDSEQVQTKKKKKRKHKGEVETMQARSAEVEEDDDSTPTAVEEMEVCRKKKKKLKRAADEATVADCLPNGGLKKKKKTKSKEQIDASGGKEVERGDDLVGVGPMEVAVEYINGHHNSTIADDAETKPKIAKKKRKSKRETFVEEEMAEELLPAPKKHTHRL